MRWVLVSLAQDSFFKIMERGYYIYNPVSYRNVVVTAPNNRLLFSSVKTGETFDSSQANTLWVNFFNQSNGGAAEGPGDLGATIFPYCLDRPYNQQPCKNFKEPNWIESLMIEEFLATNNGVR